MTKKTPSTSRSDFDEAALFFHRYPKPGKLEIQATKPLGNQRDLALAYSPGVAAPASRSTKTLQRLPNTPPGEPRRRRIERHCGSWPWQYRCTCFQAGHGRQGRPFQKFADIDVFDIEIDAHEIDRIVDVVAALEPTFGGINLEDIKAPECFEVEEQLRAK